jgi:uncharacterized protein (DUF697 family)
MVSETSRGPRKSTVRKSIPISFRLTPAQADLVTTLGATYGASIHDQARALLVVALNERADARKAPTPS